MEINPFFIFLFDYVQLNEVIRLYQEANHLVQAEQLAALINVHILYLIL